MKVAVAGLGSAAVRGHLPALERVASRHGITIAAVADRDPGRLELAGDAGAPPAFASAEEMLARVECDVLVVATDPSSHADLVELGLEHRLDVVCEKPLTGARADLDRIAEGHLRHPERAIVSLHQYRYAEAWRTIARCARVAVRLRVPFALSVEIERPGSDPFAASHWRTDVDGSGGLLADHGVHFLALAWTIAPRLDVVASLRTWQGEHESCGASIRVATGTLVLRARTGAPWRRTAVSFDAGRLSLAWRDGRLEWAANGRTVRSQAARDLADRAYVDELYTCFYTELAGRLSMPAWRANRTAETLTVGRALVELLEGGARHEVGA